MRHKSVTSCKKLFSDLIERRCFKGFLDLFFGPQLLYEHHPLKENCDFIAGLMNKKMIQNVILKLGLLHSCNKNPRRSDCPFSKVI